MQLNWIVEMKVQSTVVFPSNRANGVFQESAWRIYRTCRNVTVRSDQRLGPEDTISLALQGKTYQKQIEVSRAFGEARMAFDVNEFPARSVAKV